MITSIRLKTTIKFWLILKSWRGNIVVKLITTFVNEYFKIFLRNFWENLGNSSHGNSQELVLKTFLLQIFSGFSEELVTRNSLELVTRNSLDRVTRISSEWVTRNSLDLVPRNWLREIPRKSSWNFHRIFLWKIPGNFRGFPEKILGNFRGFSAKLLLGKTVSWSTAYIENEYPGLLQI